MRLRAASAPVHRDTPTRSSPPHSSARERHPTPHSRRIRTRGP
jgi:hypothetical protein